MKKPAILYSYLVFTLLIGCFFVSCGGGSNNGTLPVTNTNASIDSNPSVITSTPTPVLENVSVSGYIYASNITTENGETIPCINVLDVPACRADSSGNEPFVSQVANSLKEDYPEDWANADVQELYAQLNKTLSESKPLPEYNAQAQLCSAYDDTSIPVGSDGHFDNTVLTGATDSNVKLEVAFGEDSYAEVETLPSSGTINSSDATSAVLKSCPEKIFAFPGEVIIFKVYSEPGINLKSAGLKFTLNNPSIGCLTQPVYLCLFGAYKYQVAYGCVYIKPGLDTPVDTTITARLNSGQSMNIFLEVIKKTASVSGTVYTGGLPLVKGFVYSLGPKACCKIDASGQYSLPKVFRGHSRSVIATWWTSENGKKIRHREEKVIDFFSQDVTGFTFGVPPTPTPTLTPTATPTPRPPYDDFYREKLGNVLSQYDQWETGLGVIEANQHTIKWLNGEVPDGPPIPDGIAGAVSIGNPYDIWVKFKDGMSICISTSDPIIIKNEDTGEPLPEKEEIKPLTHLTAASSNNTTVKNADIIMLSPYHWQTPDGIQVETRILDELTNNNYNVKCIKTEENKDISLDWNYYYPFPLVRCIVLNWDNMVFPWTLATMGKYGIIYINTHGGPVTIDEKKFDPNNVPSGEVFRMSCTVDGRNSMVSNAPTPLDAWAIVYLDKMFTPLNKEGWWFYRLRKIKDFEKEGWIVELALTNHYLDYLNSNSETNFKDSLVYWNGCYAWHLRNSFNTAKLFIGYDRSSYSKWAYPFAYDFFWFMMYGTRDCPNIDPKNGKLFIPGAPLPLGTPSYDEDKPLDATEALNALTDYYKVNPDPMRYYIDTENGDCNYCTAKKWQKAPDEHIYFPVPVTVTVEK